MFRNQFVQLILQFVTGISSGKIFVTLRNLSVFLLLDRHPGKQGSTLLYLLCKGLVTHTGQVFEIGIYLVLADLSVQALAFSVQILKLCLLIP